MADDFSGAIQHWRGPCPHCGTAVRFEDSEAWVGPWGWTVVEKGVLPIRGQFVVRAMRGDDNTQVFVSSGTCPHCKQTVISMTQIDGKREDPTRRWKFVWPEGVTRAPIPASVPDHIADDYREAVLVLPHSPKASAALSRRCLQHLLREQGYAQHDLVKQIDAARSDLPKYLAHELDAVRTVGNFAAHPMKCTHTGAILGVEDGEAEWSIEVLELLFDHFYLHPDDARVRRDALNKKLKDAGKKPLASS